jgi:transcriptional regulator with XRE-family HTH domain
VDADATIGEVRHIMPPLQVRLAQTVRSLRQSAKFSQEAFAYHIKVHRTFMSSIERGKVNVSLATLERLARGLEMSAWELLRIAEVGGPSAQASTPDIPRRAKTPYNPPQERGERPRKSDRKVAEERDR